MTYRVNHLYIGPKGMSQQLCNKKFTPIVSYNKNINILINFSPQSGLVVILHALEREGSFYCYMASSSFVADQETDPFVGVLNLRRSASERLPRLTC